MRSELLQLIDMFAGLRVLVLGDAMLDSYFDGAAERLCREAPVPVVTVQRRVDQPGGAANTAANLRALGAEVALLAVAGDDVEGSLLREALAVRGVGVEHLLTQSGRATLAKSRLSAAAHLLVRFDQGDAGPIDAATEARLIARLWALFPTCDAMVISDYCYGVLTPAVIDTVETLNAAFPRVLVGDSKRLRAYRQVGLTAVKPNFDEAVRLLGPRRLDGAEGRVAAAAEHGERLLGILNTRIACLTMDHDGALTFERGAAPYRTYAAPRPHTRAAGAGDTYVSALTMALAAGADAQQAAELAAAAAAVVVEHEGTAVCAVEVLRASLEALAAGEAAPPVRARAVGE